MRNHRFRLSDMIPNAWFYKLKGMGKKSGKNQSNNNNSCNKKHQNQSCSSLSSSSYSSTKTITQRKSYYFTRDLNCPPPHHHISPEPPRKSSHKCRSAATAASRATTPRNLTSSVSAGSDSPLDSTSYSSEQDSLLPDLLPSSAAAAAAAERETFDGMLSHCEFDTVSKIKTSLTPIITKPKKFDNNILLKPQPNQNQLYRSIVKKNTDNNIVTRNRGNREKQRTCSVLKKTGHSPGLKLRTNSPRIGNRRITQGRKSTSIVGKSFAVVKSSNDPQRDFMESMVEMIVENNIRGSKDLENLLACYLSLNANEYHDLIIKVFKQIWFDITDVRLK